MNALLTQHKYESALLSTKPTRVAYTTWHEMLRSAHSALILCLGDQETLKLEDMMATLNFRELQMMTKAKDDGGEGLYVRGRSDQGDIKQGKGSARSKSRGRGSKLMCYICNSEEHLKRDCPMYNKKKS
nr:zinc finger, CCHC-type [Tanacetum cinerariifolium]